MLYNKATGYVFIAIPKTATRSIYTLLQKNYGGLLYKEHETIIPEHLKTLFSFCVVRNPYDRICSAWWSSCMRGKYTEKYGYQKIFREKNLPNSLESFLSILHKQRRALEYPQCKFIKNNRIDKMIKFENLNNEINTLPFIKKTISLTTENTTRGISEKNPFKRPHWKEIINTTTGQMIDMYFNEDFKICKYNKEYSK